MYSLPNTQSQTRKAMQENELQTDVAVRQGHVALQQHLDAGSPGRQSDHIWLYRHFVLPLQQHWTVLQQASIAWASCGVSSIADGRATW
jgi:hypothetical protein